MHVHNPSTLILLPKVNAWPVFVNSSRKKGKILSSAYELKYDCCLFERLFKVKKNGIFLLGISFFFVEIFMFLYCADEESDDIIGGSTKKYNTQSRISPEISEQCSSNLAPEMHITKET